MKIIRPTTITDAMFVTSNLTEADYAAWSVSTSYTAGDRCIVTTGVHKIYEALTSVTGGSSPEIDVLVATPKWAEISATNRWKPFDAVISSQASNASSITYSLKPGRIDSLAFLNLDATSITVKLTDPVDGEVYNSTINLYNGGPVFDWYSYFFEEITYKTDLVLTDIPIFGGATLEIAISSGGTVLVGEIIPGRQFDIGKMQYSPSLSLDDYSTISRDTFGNVTIVERPYSKKLKCNIRIDNSRLDIIHKTLCDYRATPIVVIGSEDYASMIVYGIRPSFTIVVPYKDFSDCSLETEGLI